MCWVKFQTLPAPRKGRGKPSCTLRCLFPCCVVSHAAEEPKEVDLAMARRKSGTNDPRGETPVESGPTGVRGAE